MNTASVSIVTSVPLGVSGARVLLEVLESTYGLPDNTLSLNDLVDRDLVTLVDQVPADQAETLVASLKAVGARARAVAPDSRLVAAAQSSAAMPSRAERGAQFREAGKVVALLFAALGVGGLAIPLMEAGLVQPGTPLAYAFLVPLLASAAYSLVKLPGLWLRSMSQTVRMAGAIGSAATAPASPVGEALYRHGTLLRMGAASAQGVEALLRQLAAHAERLAPSARSDLRAAVERTQASVHGLPADDPRVEDATRVLRRALDTLTDTGIDEALADVERTAAQVDRVRTELAQLARA